MKTTVKNGKTFAQRSDLKPWDDNPRDIKPAELKQLVADIQEFGQFKPIIVNASGLVLGGNQRLKAFEELGIDEIWVSIIEEDNRERWLLKLRVARSQGQVAVFGAMQPKPADILPIDMHPRYQPHFEEDVK